MNDIFNANTHMHFGAIVYISCLKDYTNFYLCSSSITFKTLIYVGETQSPIDPNMCLFTICPPIKFQSEQFLDSILQNKYIDDNEIAEYEEKKAKVFIEQFQFQLKQNNSIKQQQIKFPVKYNQSFMLQHKFSAKYLCFNKDTDTNQYILQLSDIPTVKCLFNIKACFNYQKDVNTYIPFNSAAFLTAKLHEGLQVRQLCLQFNNQSIFNSWSFSEQTANQIKFGLYQTGDQTEFKNIYYGDSVWIFHLQSGSFVKILQQNFSQGNILLNKVKYKLGYLKQQGQIVEKMSQIIIQKSDNQLSAEKFGLWKILSASSKKKFKGGKLKYDQEVRFYNVRYNSYLGVRKIKIGRNKFNHIFSMEEHEEENTVFSLKSLSSSSQFATTQDLFLIKNLLTNTYMTLNQAMEINQTTAVLQPSQSYKKQDNFKLTKIDYLQQWQNNYILSILPFFYQGINQLKMAKNGHSTQRGQVILKLLSQNLIQMLTFSYDLTEGFEASESKLGKMTYNHFLVQKLLRQQGITVKLIQILQLINPQRLLKIDKESHQKPINPSLKILGLAKIVKKYSVGIKQGDDRQFKLQESLFRKIIDTSFKILRNCCKFNTENSLHAFKELQIFIKYLGYGTYAQNFMMQAFHNTQILQHITSTQFKMIISQYIKVSQLSNYYQPKMFQLLKQFLKIGQKSLSKNQLQVFRLMKANQSLMLSIKQRDGQFVVNYQGTQNQLNQFCIQNLKLSKFISEQIRFYAELCSDRNYVCSKTIKKMFPISTVYNYIRSHQVQQSLKLGFLWIIMNCYLDERPRFKAQRPAIFSIPKQLAIQQSQQQVPQFQKQIKMMKNQGLNQESIDDIISCIHQADSMTENHLVELQQLIIREIETITKQENTNSIYSQKTLTYLICLKNLIQLSVFRQQQSKNVEKLISQIMSNIMKLMAVSGQKKMQAQSQNFRELLLQMVEKNIIKKFDFSVKYDGVEDQVKEDNICSIFVNYAFYQNILLQQKDPYKRQNTNSVINVMLQLIGIYSKMRLGDKFRVFTQQIMRRQQIQRRITDRKQFIESVILNRILQIEKGEVKQTLTLLILLFYNSNSYQINYLTINKFLQQIFANRQGLSNLKTLIFTIDQKQKQELDSIRYLYKGIKLLSQTSEIWLNVHQATQNYNSKYDSVIMFFMNKIKAMIKIIMPKFNENARDPLSEIKHSKTIDSQKQIILSNFNVENQILQFLSNYRVLINAVKQEKNPFNRILPQLFKICYLFLYIFIYENPQNKKKISSTIKQLYLMNFSSLNIKRELGETILIIQFLKNNYEECIDFFNRNPEIYQKSIRYTSMHSRLLICLLTFYDQPIRANLRKFFISIFDFASFRKFLFFKGKDNQLELDIDQLSDQKQPLIYHINALQMLILVLKHIPQAKNALKSHIKKSLTQNYLFKLLKMDDYYTKQNSNRAILKLAIRLKEKIMKIIQLVYLSQQVRDQQLFFHQLKRQNDLLNKLIQQSAARKENENFRKIYIMRQMVEQEHINDVKIQQLYDMNFLEDHLLQIYLHSIDSFCGNYYYSARHHPDEKISQMAMACDDIQKKVKKIHQILYNVPKKQQNNEDYPVPYNWILQIKATQKDQVSLSRKKYVSSLIIELIFNKKIYQKIFENQGAIIGNLSDILKQANLKQFSFLRKLSQFFEDAFQRLGNSDDPQICENLRLLIQLLATWLKKSPPQSVNELRFQIGRSQLIFPILNYFQTCKLNKLTKQLFLECLNFFNQLIGIEGNKGIQAIFNQYFNNKADSLQFFMKIKQLFQQINFQDRANYKCKKIFDGVQTYYRDSQLKKMPQFVLLNFLICLCKGKYRQNQIFLGSLSNISNFNIMSGIWEILKYQCQKYDRNLINVANYDLITQCFSTINELVKGPCVENQNQFLKKDFFQTVLHYFTFEPQNQDLTLEKPIENKMQKFSEISADFTQKLRIFLNSDKITYQWMPSQVKYVCTSLICSLLSQNQNQQGKLQLYTFSPQLLVKQLDKVYLRYIDAGLEYSYKNMEVQSEKQVILPLGYKLYELLQYYPKDKVPISSPGIDFFKTHSRIVQVLHNDKLSLVVFPHSPNQISQAFKTTFLQKVDRTSVNSKLRGLQQAQIQQKQSDYPYGYLLFIIVIMLTIIDILLYNYPDGVPFVQSFLFLPILRNYGYQIPLDVIASSLIVLGTVLSLVFFILQMNGAISLKHHIKSQLQSVSLSKWQKVKRILSLISQNSNQFHYCFILFLFILAAFNPFFDVIILILQLYKRSQIFSSILKAIGDTLDQLCVVLLFTLVCTYILTGIFYYYIGVQWFPAQCQTLYYCFVFSLDNGFRADAGLVGYADDEDTILEDDVTISFGTVLLNFIYLLIIKVIIDQIIGAIMVDKFAQIRETKQKIEEDQNSNCFICGIERNLLDREQDGFVLHRQKYHNIWNYFQFLSYLRKMKPHNFSGLQLYVYQQQKNDELNWYPINRSWHLQHKKKNQQKQKQQQNQIQVVSKQLNNQIDNLNLQIHQIWQLLNVKIAKQKAQKG